MKVLLTTQPGLGHFHPMRPVALALQRAGHEVRVACAQSFIPAVEACGLRAVPAGLDWLLSQPEKQFPEMSQMSMTEQSAFFTQIFIDVAAHYMAHDILELSRDWQPDIIVREQTEYGGCVAAERLGLVHAVLGFEFYLPDYLTRLKFEEPLAYLRSTFGLPPHPAMEMLDHYLYLSCVPPSYQFPDFTLPPTAWPVRPVFAPPLDEVSLPRWALELPERPTVYVSLGTVFSRWPDVFKIILDGLGDMPYNVVITLGGTRDPAELGAVPSNVRLERYIPHDTALMPRWDLVITHGGASTTLGALSCGRPVLVIPLGDPQLLHAARCAAMQVGQALLPPWYGDAPSDLSSNLSATQAVFIDSHTPILSAETLRQTVEILLGDARYRQSAQRLQREVEALPGPEQAVSLLERLVTERRPLMFEPQEQP